MHSLTIGQEASFTKTLSAEDVEAFAVISGDANPVHLDEAYAAGTVFKHRIAHGILTAGLISATIGTHLPGPGTIYLSQSLRFEKPVYLGDTITATIRVKILRADKPIATLETVCTNQAGVVVLSGEAVVLLPAKSA
ncbi:MAG: enoyl-CoA hydratase [Deltaproteobacteria bacterium RIFOXYA12_FULL_61_11]|nr:MAG: enoyl-CoA hydratase [Deltaproteobacteria bacterium RIFOXYA12_FULL_61_11]